MSTRFRQAGRAWGQKTVGCCRSCDSPHAVLRGRIRRWGLTQIREKRRFALQKKREETRPAFRYLPVSSFEHHGEGSVSNQILPAVLEISHGLHSDGGTEVQMLMEPLKRRSLAQKR